MRQDADRPPKGEKLTLGRQEMLKKCQIHGTASLFFCLLIKIRVTDKTVTCKAPSDNAKKIIEASGIWLWLNWPNKSLQTSYSMIQALFYAVCELRALAPAFLQTVMHKKICIKLRICLA